MTEISNGFALGRLNRRVILQAPPAVDACWRTTIDNLLDVCLTRQSKQRRFRTRQDHRSVRHSCVHIRRRERNHLVEFQCAYALVCGDNWVYHDFCFSQRTKNVIGNHLVTAASGSRRNPRVFHPSEMSFGLDWRQMRVHTDHSCGDIWYYTVALNCIVEEFWYVRIRHWIHVDRGGA